VSVVKYARTMSQDAPLHPVNEVVDSADAAQPAIPTATPAAPADAADAPDAKALAATMRGELDAVEHALGRIDDETYGNCEACSEPIADEVLRSTPTANLCGQHA
jgi:RNA polymerase-binding transcription factor DksA